MDSEPNQFIYNTMYNERRKKWRKKCLSFYQIRPFSLFQWFVLRFWTVHLIFFSPLHKSFCSTLFTKIVRLWLFFSCCFFFFSKTIWLEVDHFLFMIAMPSPFATIHTNNHKFCKLCVCSRIKYNKQLVFRE